MSEVLCDTDILSALAKAESLKILNSAFPSCQFVISESVVDELKRAEEVGFEFPSRIFKFCKTTTMTEEELQKYSQTNYQGLSKTDTKNIIIAKERRLSLLTNDNLLYKKAGEEGVTAFDLKQILTAVIESETLDTAEIKKVLNKIERKDNTQIQNKEDIFKKQS